MYASMQSFRNALAYFATAVSYARKMVMKSTLGGNVIKPFTFVILPIFVISRSVC
jgi:hypothetical protein